MKRGYISKFHWIFSVSSVCVSDCTDASVEYLKIKYKKKNPQPELASTEGVAYDLQK